jgi:hypothetical protein
LLAGFSGSVPGSHEKPRPTIAGITTTIDDMTIIAVNDAILENGVNGEVANADKMGDLTALSRSRRFRLTGQFGQL